VNEYDADGTLVTQIYAEGTKITYADDERVDTVIDIDGTIISDSADDRPGRVTDKFGNVFIYTYVENKDAALFSTLITGPDGTEVYNADDELVMTTGMTLNGKGMISSCRNGRPGAIANRATNLKRRISINVKPVT